MRKPFRGIRWKLVFICCLSILLTILTAFFLQQLMRSLVSVFYDQRFYYYSYLVQRLNANIGFPVVPSLAVPTLFIFYLWLLSRGIISQLMQIIEGVKRLSKENFEREIPVWSEDELGELTGNINRMAEQWKKSIEEERHAVQTRNELITNVSHDLRTPLTSIIGYLRLIEEDRYKDEVELRYYTNVAYTKSRKLERMVNDLFEMTKLSMGPIALNRSDIDLVELAGQLSADFAPQLREAEMEINVACGEQKMMVWADGSMLMRALENLISNAIKYGKRGRTVDVVIRQESGNAVLQVINYRAPIPKEDLPYLFERFYRVEKSRSEETGGSGLGLAIVKSIIELHDGLIKVRSDARETAFEISLPMRSKHKSARP
ncbi:sensor histidine kinase [Paenibacillus sedimenti]|uniref:histidine kinase n=1 Tax=Paenibacillus sedimenti TaxID=2770274 RepID=A0A926KNE7_9BACL|nr:HAMP domain-containing sensor histidine kinase [Paenibacillus sedimenti]MBD0379220.1 HAMP domain-containing histidine kinase [Paenibacillus sedimenti]